MEPTRLCLIWRNIRTRALLWLYYLAERAGVRFDDPTPQEQQLLAQLWAEREKELQEIGQTVRTFITAYPSLEPSNFLVPATVPLQAYWLVYHSLMMLAERVCDHAPGQPEFVSVQIANDGSLLINGNFSVPAPMARNEVFRLIGQQIPEVDETIAGRLVCWLCAAGQKHAPLLDPQLNRCDPSGQSDFLAAWRIN